MMEQPLALMPGERVVLTSHPHWWYFWKYVLALFAVLLVFVLGVWADGGIQTFLLWVALVGIVVVAMATAVQFLQWRTTTFAVTDKRVAYQSGLVSRRGVSIPLNRVNNVNFHQGVVARLLNNGTVTIESAGEAGESVFSNIPDPQHVRQVIFAQMEADEVGDSRRDAAAIAEALRGPGTSAAGSPSAPGDATARLQQLADLRAKGLISEQEYQSKRAEVLGGL
jgi:uncharacterized membrane protein YdbT with pleckstrin-like domain